MNKFIIGNTELTAVNVKKVNNQLSLLFTSSLDFSEVKALFVDNTEPIVYHIEDDSGTTTSETNYTGYTAFRSLSQDADEVYTVKLEIPSTADVIATLQQLIITANDDMSSIEQAIDTICLTVLPTITV